MTRRDRWFLAVALCVLAAGHAGHFLEYRAVGNGADGAGQVIFAVHAVEAARPCEPPPRCDAMRGQILIREGHTRNEAALGGALIPLLLLILAGYLALGGGKRPNE